MKINQKILSIPPYISTSWKNIASLHVENEDSVLVLVVTLLNGSRIELPHLDGAMIEAIFSMHEKVLDLEAKASQRAPIPYGPALDETSKMSLPIKELLPGLENFGTMLQHNSEDSNAPDMPPELLEKITMLSQTLGINDPNMIPKAEPHCNCMYCQVSKAIHAGITQEIDRQKEEEEIVTDAELTFRTWDVAQTGDKLFSVTSPLDPKEHFKVFLGETIGCTCGEKHCEHIRAVLSS